MNDPSGCTCIGGIETCPVHEVCPDCGGLGHSPDLIDGPVDVSQDYCRTCDGMGRQCIIYQQQEKQ